MPYCKKHKELNCNACENAYYEFYHSTYIPIKPKEKKCKMCKKVSHLARKVICDECRIIFERTKKSMKIEEKIKFYKKFLEICGYKVEFIP